MGPFLNHVYAGDCMRIMRQWPDDCIDVCIADPPFNIASGGGRRSKKGLGWAFSSHVTMQETWDAFGDEEYFRFAFDWLREVCRVVRPNGNILVFGTYHNIYLIGFVLEHLLNRRILNSIVWFKPNAQPNITARTLTESTEHIIWAVNETPKRAKNWTFNYTDAKSLNGHKQMRNFWNELSFPLVVAPVAPQSERVDGSHPAQKPRAVVDRLIQLFSKRGDLVLDPFAGTGVVALSAYAYMRNFTAIEKSRRYAAVARTRLERQLRSREGLIIRRTKESAMTLNDIELSILQRAPVPQADDLNKVFDVVELVDAGLDTAIEIAEGLGLSQRQGPYYAEAAVALRIIGVQKDISAHGADRFYLTELGRDYLAAKPERRESIRRFAVLNSPIVKYISSNLGITNNGELAPYPPAGQMLDEDKISGVLRDFSLSGITLNRRAQTIKTWLTAI